MKKKSHAYVFLKKVIEKKDNKIARLNKLIDNLDEKIYKLKNPEPKNRKRPRDNDDSFLSNTKKKKPKTHQPIDKQERDEKLLKIFLNFSDFQ